MSKNQDPSIKGKKLLLIGGIQNSADLIDLCHRNGAQLGVTDFIENSQIKQNADEAYNIDAFDVDGLAKLCRDKHYNGVITEYIDRILPIVADVAEKTNLYSPFTTEQIKMSSDKDFFLHTCIAYGVPTPKLYDIESESDLGKNIEIDFPVLVKPVDNSSSRGLKICRNMDELKDGLKAAKESSHSGRVQVEAYLPYDEINVTYIAQDGDIQLAAIHDRYFNESQNGVMKVPDMYIYPSRYTQLYYETVNDKVINMLKGIGIKNGSLFMQAIVHDNMVFFYEAGMRLNGCKTYQILEYENDYNTQEHLAFYCLTGDMGRHQDFDARFRKWYATWNVIAKPGKTCAKYINEDALISYPWLIKIDKAYVAGEKIRDNSAGTLLQLAARIHLMADNKEQLLERIEKLQDLFDILDENGNSILLAPHDLDDLREKLDYDL